MHFKMYDHGGGERVKMSENNNQLYILLPYTSCRGVHLAPSSAWFSAAAEPELANCLHVVLLLLLLLLLLAPTRAKL